MDIKEFISQTLKQIIDGVLDAQDQTRKSNAVVVPYGDNQKKGWVWYCGRIESFEKTLFKTVDRKYWKNKMQFEEDFSIIVELKGSAV